MVRGCLAWQHDGLTPIPESVRAATDDYAESSDMLQAFLSEAIELVPDAEVRAAELFDHSASGLMPVGSSPASA